MKKLIFCVLLSQLSQPFLLFSQSTDSLTKSTMNLVSYVELNGFSESNSHYFPKGNLLVQVTETKKSKLLHVYDKDKKIDLSLTVHPEGLGRLHGYDFITLNSFTNDFLEKKPTCDNFSTVNGKTSFELNKIVMKMRVKKQGVSNNIGTLTMTEDSISISLAFVAKNHEAVESFLFFKDRPWTYGKRIFGTKEESIKSDMGSFRLFLLNTETLIK